MSIRDDLYINQLAQGVLPAQEAFNWFKKLAEVKQLEILRRLAFFILQSAALGRDIDDAIKKSGLKSTYTPCVILSNASSKELDGNKLLKIALSKVVNLPSPERLKSFRLLLALFTISSVRQRQSLDNLDGHWWLKDLSDENVVESILHES